MSTKKKKPEKTIIKEETEMRKKFLSLVYIFMCLGLLVSLFTTPMPVFATPLQAVVPAGN